MSKHSIPFEHIDSFINPENYEQTMPNRRADFTHKALTSQLISALEAGFDIQPLTVPDMMPKNALQLQIFEQFSPEAGLELAQAITALRMTIPVTLILRPDAETYDLKKDHNAFMHIINKYGAKNVSLGIHIDAEKLQDSTLSPEQKLSEYARAFERQFNVKVTAVSIASGPGHDADWMKKLYISAGDYSLINVNHTDFTDRETAIMQSDSTAGWYGPFKDSIATAKQQQKPLIWRSATGQWITPEPMTAWDSLKRFGVKRFPKQFVEQATAGGRRFINGQTGSVVIKHRYEGHYKQVTRSATPQGPRIIL